MESIGTLGLVDLAYVFPHYLKPDFREDWGMDEDAFTSRYDGVLYVRLNALGSYCLGFTDDFEVQPVGNRGLFRVLPNHEIVLSGNGPPSPNTTHFLSCMAVRTSDLVWKIDSAVVLDYLESGRSFQVITDFLHANAIDGAPPQVIAFLEDIERKAIVCRKSEEALLIELVDTQTAARIAHDPLTAKYCRPVGDQAVVTLTRNVKVFRSSLKKMGLVWPYDILPSE